MFLMVVIFSSVWPSVHLQQLKNNMEENYRTIATLHHLLNYEASKFAALKISGYGTAAAFA